MELVMSLKRLIAVALLFASFRALAIPPVPPEVKTAPVTIDLKILK
jgi:hypothetical protein